MNPEGLKTKAGWLFKTFIKQAEVPAPGCTISVERWVCVCVCVCGEFGAAGNGGRKDTAKQEGMLLSDCVHHIHL